MLNKQLTEQLEQEAKDYAQERWDNLFGKLHLHRKTLMMFAHLAGTKEYAEKWQEAEQRALKFEKALREIQEYLINCRKHQVGSQGDIILPMIGEALTPKTGSDDR